MGTAAVAACAQLIAAPFVTFAEALEAAPAALQQTLAHADMNADGETQGMLSAVQAPAGEVGVPAGNAALSASGVSAPAASQHAAVSSPKRRRKKKIYVRASAGTDVSSPGKTLGEWEGMTLVMLPNPAGRSPLRKLRKSATRSRSQQSAAHNLEKVFQLHPTLTAHAKPLEPAAPVGAEGASASAAPAASPTSAVAAANAAAAEPQTPDHKCPKYVLEVQLVEGASLPEEGVEVKTAEGDVVLLLASARSSPLPKLRLRSPAPAAAQRRPRPSPYGTSLARPPQEGVSLARPSHENLAAGPPPEFDLALEHDSPRAAAVWEPPADGFSLARPPHEGICLARPSYENLAAGPPAQPQTRRRPASEPQVLRLRPERDSTLPAPQQFSIARAGDGLHNLWLGFAAHRQPNNTGNFAGIAHSHLPPSSSGAPRTLDFRPYNELSGAIQRGWRTALSGMLRVDGARNAGVAEDPDLILHHFVADMTSTQRARFLAEVCLVQSRSRSDIECITL